MKKLLLILLLLVGTFTAKAQVATLEKEINDSTSWVYEVYNSTDVVFFLLNGDAKVYDRELTFKKLFQTATFGNKVSEIQAISKNIFTTDGKYEITVKYVIKEDSILDDEGIFLYMKKTYGYKVCNETGGTIFDFDEYEPQYWALTGSELNLNTAKLITFREYKDVNSNYYKFTRIYNLPNYAPLGTGAKSLVMLQKKPSRSYPNPGKESITIEYNIQGTALQSMEIMNIAGKIVDRVLVNPSEKKVQLNTSNYASDAYVYRIGNNTGKFIIQ